MSDLKKPKFLEGEELDDFYYSVPDPYTLPPPSHIDHQALMKYARENGKKIVDLTKEEFDQFRTGESG